MNDPATTTNEPAPPAATAAPPYHHRSVPAAWSRARIEATFRVGVFLALLVIGGIATLRGYLALEHAILVWLRPQWVPVAQAAFSVVIVAACVWLIRSWVIARSE